MKRVLAISLDGFERAIAEEMMRSGEMPALSEIRQRSVRFLLEHGSALRTGLGAEHVSSGLSPEDANRWSSLRFDKNSYEVIQEGPKFPPFPSQLDARSVSFDLPYFDLSLAPNVMGVSAWGAHDAGTALMSNPPGLKEELLGRYGPYPASKSMYAVSWPSAAGCKTVGDELRKGVETREGIALWLLQERIPDWDLALIGISEAHSALEALWHGYDKGHPLHHHSSASEDRIGIRGVYQAIDSMIGKLRAAFENAAIILFSIHGMGPNQSDVPSMALLPELLYRREFGKPFFVQRPEWTGAAGGMPILKEEEKWSIEVAGRSSNTASLPSILKQFVPATAKRALRNAFHVDDFRSSQEHEKSVAWMPAAKMQPVWHKMHAFALPSFYDGRIRINLIDREKNGMVALEDYETTCRKIEDTLRECRDTISGDSVVKSIDYAKEDPLILGPTAADMTIVWEGAPLGFEHPTLGTVGPFPYRRTGGHTGPYGLAYVSTDSLFASDHDVRSSFDVVPTIFHLLDREKPENISGRSLLRSYQ